MKQLTLLFFIFLISCGGGPKGKTLAEVGDKRITEGDLEFLSGINPGMASQLATPFGKKQVVDNLVEYELLYQAALKKGTQNDLRVKAKLDLYRKVIVGKEFVDREIENEARKYYDEHKNEFEQLRLAHLMIRYATPANLKQRGKEGEKRRTEQEALELANKTKARTDGGEDFAKLTQELSDDPVTKDQGGDLGFASKTEKRLERRGFAPLLEKAFTMKVGEVAGPIKTGEGYHLLKLTEPAGVRSFEEVKNQITFRIREEARNKILAELKQKIKVAYAKELTPEPPKAPESKVPEIPPAAPKPETNQ